MYNHLHNSKNVQYFNLPYEKGGMSQVSKRMAIRLASKLSSGREKQLSEKKNTVRRWFLTSGRTGFRDRKLLPLVPK